MSSDGNEQIPDEEYPEPLAEDVASVDAAIRALYAAVSFRPPDTPDWRRLRSLLFPGAPLVHAFPGMDLEEEVMDVEAFIERMQQVLDGSGPIAERGFREREIARHIDRFGRVAHVFSCYESSYADDPETTLSRGINSIQLFDDGQRWWVLSILWDDERPSNPIPIDRLFERGI